MPESVHLTDYPEPKEEFINEKLMDDMELVIEMTSMGRALRKDSKIKVRQPLSKLVIIPQDKAQTEFLKENIPVLKEELNIKEIVIDNNFRKYGSVTLKPNLVTLGQTYGNKLPRIIERLNEQEVVNALLEKGSYKFNIDDTLINITRASVFFEVKGSENYIGTFDEGSFAFLDTTITEDLKKEGIARENCAYNTEFKERGRL